MKKTLKKHLLSALIVCLACPTFTGCHKDEIKYGSRYRDLFSSPFVYFCFNDNNSFFNLRYNHELSKPLTYYYVFNSSLEFNPFEIYTPRHWVVVSDFQFTIDVFQTTEDDNWADPDNWKKIDMKFDMEGLPGKEVSVWHSDSTPFCKWTISATYPIGHFIIKPRVSYKYYPDAVIDENYNIVSLGEAVIYDSANKESIDRPFEYFDFWTVLVQIYDLPVYLD